MVEYIYRLFFSDKKKGLSFLGGIILKTWHWSPHPVRLSCLTRNVVELFFPFFFSSFFDERNVVELTKQTRQRIESKDLKTLCETRKLYIFLVSLCEN